MVEVPVDDAGIAHPGFDRVQLGPEALGFETIAPGGHQHVLRTGSVPAYTAVQPYLFQRHPFPVIGHYHREGRGAALQRFHLHHDGHPDPACFYGLPDFIVLHIHSPLS